MICTQLTSASSKRMQSSTSQAMRCRLLETRRMTLKISTLTNELKRIQIVTTKTQYARRIPPLRSGTGSRYGFCEEQSKPTSSLRKTISVQGSLGISGDPWKASEGFGKLRKVAAILKNPDKIWEFNNKNSYLIQNN